MTKSTLVIIKPDGVKRNLSGVIINRIEQKGYKIVDMKMMQISESLASKHYAEHKDRPFFRELVDFITSGKVIVMNVTGNEAVLGIRNIVGATDPIKAASGTIRGDFANDIASNLVHASDSDASAQRELEIFFGGA